MTLSTGWELEYGLEMVMSLIEWAEEYKLVGVWTNCYHAYPAHAAFGGYKQSGIGRETHKMMLNHYRQVKNLHVSYSEKKLGFF